MRKKRKMQSSMEYYVFVILPNDTAWGFKNYLLVMTQVILLCDLFHLGSAPKAGKFPSCMIAKNLTNACNNTKWLPSDDLLTEILHIFP